MLLFMKIFLENKISTLFRSGKNNSVGRTYEICEIKFNLQIVYLFASEDKVNANSLTHSKDRI